MFYQWLRWQLDSCGIDGLAMTLHHLNAIIPSNVVMKAPQPILNIRNDCCDFYPPIHFSKAPPKHNWKKKAYFGKVK